MTWLATNTLVIVVESDPKTQDSKGRYLRRYIRSQLMRVLREDRLGTRRPPTLLQYRWTLGSHDCYQFAQHCPYPTTSRSPPRPRKSSGVVFSHILTPSNWSMYT